VSLDIAAFFLLQWSPKGETVDARNEPAARVFYALVPPASLRQTLATLGRDVAGRAHGRVVPADNLHITLAFVGAWPVSRLSHWIDAGARCAAPAMHVTLDTLGGFRRAGVAWIGVGAPPVALLELGGTLNAALSAAGVAVDARAFHPHLTLARKCRGPFPHESAGPYEWDIDAIALMQSHTHPDGARYVELVRWPLGASPGNA
jgi:2'-5' RNA ligase